MTHWEHVIQRQRENFARLRKTSHVTHMSVSVWSVDDSLQANNTTTERAFDDPDSHSVTL